MLGIWIVVVDLFSLSGCLCYACGLARFGFVGVLDLLIWWFSGCLCVWLFVARLA